MFTNFVNLIYIDRFLIPVALQKPSFDIIFQSQAEISSP
jgi:hypothetical protein